ncbi:MAG TPA: MerR family transcriptional regulator [Gemmatimonadaceae bacterium]
MHPITIGEVARQAGIRQSAIRYYETEGLLPAPGRVGGRRVFGADVVDRLRVIKTARELGFTLDEIRTLLHGFSPDTPPSERWQRLAAKKLLEVNALIVRATRMKGLLEKGLRCDCVTVGDCILHDCSPPVTLGRRRIA